MMADCCLAETDSDEYCRVGGSWEQVIAAVIGSVGVRYATLSSRRRLLSLRLSAC